MTSLKTLAMICQEAEHKRFEPDNFIKRFNEYKQLDKSLLFKELLISTILIFNGVLIANVKDNNTLLGLAYSCNLLGVLSIIIYFIFKTNDNLLYSDFLSYQPDIFEDVLTAKYCSNTYKIEATFKKQKDGLLKFHKNIKISMNNNLLFQGIVFRNENGKLSLLSL